MYLDTFTFTDLFVGRHGQSMANLASDLAHKGDEALVEKIRHLHTSQVPLSPEGVAQSVRKGKRLIPEVGMSRLSFYVTSAYVRAIETGFHMSLPGAEWKHDPRINERDWGPMDQISPRERTERWPGWKLAKETDPYRWRPVHGETLEEKQRAAHLTLVELSELHADTAGVIVAHGETNLAIQADIEHILPYEFKDRERTLRMDNATFIHYRRRGRNELFKRLVNPHTGETQPWQQVR